MNDQQLEQQIQAKGLTAPRVTLDQVEALMARVTYVGGRVGETTSTVVHAFLDGQFLLASGHSACVSAVNFDAEFGFGLAKSNAEKKARDALWQLEGYALQKRLAAEAQSAAMAQAVASSSGLQPHQRRVVDEKAELDERLGKLRTFLAGDIFKALDEAEQTRLVTQASCMQELSEILGERIAAFTA